jgi:hypothetical protein
MKIALVAAFSGFLIGFSGAGVAAGTGVDLQKQCAEAVKAMDGTAIPASIDFGDAGRCMGLVDGFAGAAAYYESKPGSPRSICFPAEGVTIGQSVRVVDRYLQSHPEQLHESPTVLIFGAFVTAYPCL